MYYSTTKKLGSKNQKKNLCRGPSLALGKGLLCRGPRLGPSAKTIYKKKIWPKNWFQKNLCRGPSLGPSAKTFFKKHFAEKLVSQKKKPLPWP